MKKVIALLLIGLVLIVAFFYSADLSIEGEWNAEEIILNGKKVETIYPYVKVNDWVDSLYIYQQNHIIKAKIKLKKDIRNQPYAMLSSLESPLNGKFSIVFDTIPNSLYYSDEELIVDVRLQSENAYLHLQRAIHPIAKNKPIIFPGKGRP